MHLQLPTGMQDDLLLKSIVALKKLGTTGGTCTRTLLQATNFKFAMSSSSITVAYALDTLIIKSKDINLKLIKISDSSKIEIILKKKEL